MLGKGLVRFASVHGTFLLRVEIAMIKFGEQADVGVVPLWKRIKGKLCTHLS